MSENVERKEEFMLRQFMRNNYFCGKLMTVADFELEQEYFNRKRYLLNRLIYGKGLLCGFRHLKVQTKRTHNEVSIIFEDGGVALDSLGQEIVVPKNIEKIVLDKHFHPFEKNNFGDTIYLYLKYSSSYISSAASEHEKKTSDLQNSKEVHCPRILEDFDVVAFFKNPVENKVEEMVFFAAIKRNSSNGELSIDELESTRWRHYLKDQPREPEKSDKSNVIATGVVYFKQPTVNSITSSPIDLKLKNMDDPVFIHLFPEEQNNILTEHYGFRQKNEHPFHVMTIFDRSSGTFKVWVVFKDESERRSIHIRWWAFKADKDYGTVEAKSCVFLTEYKFLTDPDPKVRTKIVENGLCHSGAKNCMKSGIIFGGNHYAKVGNEVALNGNPNKLAELVKEQDKEPKYLHSEWDIGGDWILKVENFDNTLNEPAAEIKLYFGKKELKSFRAFKGDLITYCEDIAGETNVPLFVTYIDEIYIPGIKSLIGEDANVVLKYTWAVSKHVRCTKTKSMEENEK